MSSLNRAASQMLTGVELLPPKVDTGTTGTGADISAYEGLGIVTVLTGAASGAGIMKVTIQDSADNSNFTAVAEFGTSGDTANTSGSNQILSYALDLDKCRQYVRAVSTLVSGTNLILGVSLHAPKKVSG